MYLDAGRVEGLLRELAVLGGPGSRVVLTFAEGDGRGRPRIVRFGLYHRLRLALGGEPLTWCPTSGEVDALLARCGLARRPTCEAALRGALLGGFARWETRDAVSERFVVAERA